MGVTYNYIKSMYTNLINLSKRLDTLRKLDVPNADPNYLTNDTETTDSILQAVKLVMSLSQQHDDKPKDRYAKGMYEKLAVNAINELMNSLERHYMLNRNNIFDFYKRIDGSLFTIDYTTACCFFAITNGLEDMDVDGLETTLRINERKHMRDYLEYELTSVEE